jgi:nitrate/nitrite-specific signal transduction histidine kinase
MKPGGGNPESYVEKVRDDTRKYVQALLEENGKLRVLTASLESENRFLNEQIASLQKDVDGHRSERDRLQKNLAAVEEENRRFSEQYVEVEQQNTDLASLYVASHRLHATLDRGEALSIVQDIICNLIGSEEIAIFESDDSDSALSLVAALGVEPAPFRTVPLGRGVIGRCARTGQIYLEGRDDDAGRRPEEAHLSACIPLHFDGRLLGAVAIFRLLPQKSGLVALDHELFELIATHAARALYCTELQARVAGAAGAGR